MKVYSGQTSKHPAQQGFSLMEMAVVLMILGTLMSGVLVAVSRTTENNRRTNAIAQLRQIEEALYGYAQATGELPCPASDTSSGKEDCSSRYGFVPVVTLGIYGNINNNIDRLLLDPWQNPIRYAVANSEFTDAATLKSLYNAGNMGASMLKVCSATTCNASEILSDTAPALILSMGADWAICTSANEIENSCEAVSPSASYPLPADDNFVVTDYSEDQFDDQLIWLSPYVLYNKLISAGKLP